MQQEPVNDVAEEQNRSESILSKLTPLPTLSQPLSIVFAGEIVQH